MIGAVLTLAYVLLSMMAGLAFYASTKHQRFAPELHQKHPKKCLGVASGLFVLALLCAIRALGLWPGVYAASTSFMLVCVVLPYITAWRAEAKKNKSRCLHQPSGSKKHVG